MGKISILTKDQTAVLSVLGTSSYIKERFYFTGGTALSEYYLHHDGQKKKFHIDYEPLTFSADLLTIDTFTELPRMITPLTLSTLREYFRKKAKKLARPSVIK